MQKIHLSDGSGNVYEAAGPPRLSVEYRPMTKAMSSSGLYDGGDPFKGTLSAEQFNRLSQLADAAASNRKGHIENRVKGSFLLIVTDGAGERMYLLNRDSMEGKEIESYLRAIRK